MFLLSLYLVGIPLAILGRLPAQFDSSGDSTDLVRDAFTNGTAASAPFYLLILLAASLLLTRRPSPWRSVGVVGATLLGLLFTIGTVGELVNYDAFTGVRQVVFLGWNALSLVLAPSLVVLGVVILSRQPRARKAAGA